jgi:tRNA-dihydrouridine synthase A
MVDTISIPVTVKHRIGIDKADSYEFVRDFVGTVAEGGARVFMVHARSAWLKGLSPKENREVPPLRYEFASRLKADFPDFTIVLNGGIADNLATGAALAGLDGVMVGRHAYHEPWFLAEVDRLWFGDAHAAPTREAVVRAMRDYAARAVAGGAQLRAVTRHMLGLYQGLPGARAWRRTLSDSTVLNRGDAGLILAAAAQVRPQRLAA